MSKRSVANKLRAAANIIDTYGWVQGSFGNESEGFCALGALIHTGYGDDLDLAERATVTVLSRLTHKRIGDIVDWNDRKGRTKEEVTGAFRRTARELEHGLEIVQ